MNATELRALLLSGNLSQRGAARLIDIDERTLRRYCAGTAPIPRCVEYAIRFVVLSGIAASNIASGAVQAAG